MPCVMPIIAHQVRTICFIEFFYSVPGVSSNLPRNNIPFFAVLLGQIMNRMKLNWRGNQESGGSSAYTLKIMFGLMVVYILFDPIYAVHPFIPGTTINVMKNMIIFASIEENFHKYKGMYPHWLVELSTVNLIIGIIFLVYLIYAMTKTRRYIREKYAIPEVYCKTGMEDCCCATWCFCCTAAHMARHTADYDYYPAKCCNETGLTRHAPSIV